MTAITATPKSVRSHIMVVEMEEESGYRHWSKPMVAAEMHAWIWQAKRFGAEVSDVDCAISCWCERE